MFHFEMTEYDKSVYEKELKDFSNELLIKMGFKQNRKGKFVLPLKARFLAFFDSHGRHHCRPWEELKC